MSVRSIIQTHAALPQRVMSTFSRPSILQRCTSTQECGECKKKRLSLGRASENVAPFFIIPPIVHSVLGSHGEPLENQTRAFMESRFGHDFSQVRVHADPQAAESAGAVNALAYTVGQEVVFGPGQYAPKTSEGQRLLAHELAHTIQQSASNNYPQSELIVSHREDAREKEAEIAARTVSHGGFDVSLSSPRSHVARQDEDQAMSSASSDNVEAGIPNISSDETHNWASDKATRQTSSVGGVPDMNEMDAENPNASVNSASLPARIQETKADLGNAESECERGANSPAAGEIFYFVVRTEDLNNAAPNGNETEHLRSYLRGIPVGSTLVVHGHASQEGNPGFNWALSRRRANKLKNMLLSMRPDLAVSKVVEHGPIRSDPSVYFYNRSATVELVSTPTSTSGKGPQLPNADYAPTARNCNPYLQGEVEDYLGTYFQQNAKSACLGTPNDAHNNCVRHCLQSKVADFVGLMKREQRPKASEVQLPPDEGTSRCRTIWQNHVQCYGDCGCENVFVQFKYFFPMCDQPFGSDFVKWSIGRYNPCMGPRTTPSVLLPPYVEP